MFIVSENEVFAGEIKLKRRRIISQDNEINNWLYDFACRLAIN